MGRFGSRTVQTGASVAVLRDERDHRVTDIRWSPDSRRIVVGTSRCRREYGASIPDVWKSRF
jgi:hypothetical protein